MLQKEQRKKQPKRLKQKWSKHNTQIEQIYLGIMFFLFFFKKRRVVMHYG